MKNLLTLIIVFAFLAIVCQPMQDNAPLKTQLQAQDTLRIALDNETPNQARTHYVMWDGHPYISAIVFQKTQNLAKFYSLINKKLAFSFSLPVQGPDGLGTMWSQPAFVAPDSIFSAITYSRKIARSDTSGRILQRWRLEADPAETGVSELLGTMQFPLRYQAGKLYAMAIGPYPSERPEFFTKPLEAVLPLDADSLIVRGATFRGAYPDFMQKGRYYGNFSDLPVRCLLPDGRSIFCFSFDPNLYLCGATGETQVLTNLASQYLPPLPEPPSTLRNNDLNETVAYTLSAGVYKEIVHDPWRKVFYRLVVHPRPVTAEDGHMVFWDAPFSVQIISEDFRLLGETSFPALRYNYFMPMLVLPEGLILPYLHPQNPYLDENAWTYVVFLPKAG